MASSVRARRSERVARGLCFAALWIPAAGHAAGLDVMVKLEVGAEQQPAAASAVVWLESAGKAPPVRARIVQRDKHFEPHVLVVPVGSEVSFPNRDVVEHNVFSLSALKPFDLGLFGPGRARSVTFKQAGLLQVYCNIHPQMVAYLWVVSSAHYGLTNAAGRIRLPKVPAGSHTLRVWHELGGSREQTIKVAPDGAMHEVLLDATAWAPMPHKNKHNEPYRNQERLY